MGRCRIKTVATIVSSQYVRCKMNESRDIDKNNIYKKEVK